MASGYNRCYIGGFVGFVNSVTATFNNCSFTGSFTYTDPDGGHDYNDTGGFIGHFKSGKISLTNCYSSVTYDDRGKVVSLGYFVGWLKGENKSFTNCYGYCLNEKGDEKTLDDYAECTNLADYGGAGFIKGGGLAMALNAGNTSYNPWAQTIGTDEVPRLKVLYPESETLANIVTNAYFNNGTTSWTFKGLRGAVVTDDNSNSIWRTGNTIDSLTQTVNLSSHFTEAELTRSTYKAVLSCDWAHQYGYKTLNVNYTFLDASGKELKSCDLINETGNSTELSALTWKTAATTVEVPTGARKVRVSLSGQDYKFWLGNFGPAFDNVSLALVKTGDIPTAINTVSQRPATTDSRRYTLSGIPAGSKAKGIIIQGGKKYVVK